MATEWNAPAVLMAAMNARQWSATALFNRGGGGNVTLPAYSGLSGGRFRDPTDFLHGRGNGATECLPAALAAAWNTSTTGAGVATCGIDSENLFYVEVTGGGAITFSITASANNAIYGFDVAGQAAVVVAGGFRCTAMNPWRLGPILNAAFTVDPTGAPAAFTVGGNRYHQDLVTAIRLHGNGDADDRNATANLQVLDATIYGNTVRWFIDETGHVVTSWATGSGGTVVPTWVSTTFRNRLGFNGLESTVSTGSVRHLRATHPLPGLVLMKDGLELHEIGSQVTRQARDLTDGGMAAVSTDIHHRRYIGGYVWGPSMGSTEDMHRHYVGSPQRPGFMAYVNGRMYVTLYPRWGDPRNWLDPMAVTSSQAAHTLLHTSGLDGYRGRVECSLAQQTQGEQRITWEGNTRQYAKIAWTLKEQT